MKKLLLGSVIALVPVVALAQVPASTNVASPHAGSTAGVSSTQGTQATTRVAGNGGAIVGAFSGNISNVQTGATGVAGPAASSTLTTAKQYNVGGTIGAGLAINANGKPMGPLPRTTVVQANGASGFASGGQTSSTVGTSEASASNLNVTMPAKQQPRPNYR
jgi:hypothetical protein